MFPLSGPAVDLREIFGHRAVAGTIGHPLVLCRAVEILGASARYGEQVSGER
jgi:hypothetical protein